jgi:hypothetical protein
MPSLDRFDDIKKVFPSILKEKLGIISQACRTAGISRETYYNWRKANPAFAAQCDEAEIIMGGEVKDRLMKRILEDDTTAIIFYCKTKLKHEGFVERVEQTGAQGGAIKTEVKLSEPDESIADMYIEKEVKRRLEEAKKETMNESDGSK